jgi:hypothetical protein
VSELERALVALGREFEVPEAPDVVPAVLLQLEPRRTRAAWRPGTRPQRRLALVVALAVLALLAAALAVPDARSALFRVFSIGGERIELVDDLPDVPVDPVELELTLGERISPAEARRVAGFDLRELEEPPDRAYLGDRGTIWFVYGEPENVRLLVAQTPLLHVDERLLLMKLAGPGMTVEPVLVDGTRGFFVSGKWHLVMLLDEFGDPVEESLRLARNVLVWEQDGVAIRLEGDFSKEEARELASSLR